MTKLSLLELLIRGVPEALIIVWSILYMADIKINVNKYFTLCIIEMITIFSIRLLPIDYGIHILLWMFIMVIINVKMNKINILKCIQITVLITIIECISEGINIALIIFVFKLNINYVFSNIVLKTLYGIPSLLITVLIVVAGKKLIKKLK